MTDPLHESLAEALFAIRQEVGPLIRGAEADTGKYTYKFVTLPALVEKVDPIALKHGVFIRHQLSGSELIHELWFNGEKTEAYSIDLPNPQETAQGFGSAVTYLRRYDYTTTLGLVVDLDDDGAAASVPRPPQNAPQAAQTRPSPRRAQTNSSTPTGDDFDSEF
jgi:hypothetical protein